MVAPGFLDNPEVRRWLNGVEPAWTMLELDSLNALRHEPSGTNHAIRLDPALANAEISGSAVTANALLLLRRAAETGGLKLTATGNLSRALVEEMCGIMVFAPFLPLPPSSTLSRSDFAKRSLSAVLKKGPHLVVLRLLRLWPLLLLTHDRRARAAD